MSTVARWLFVAAISGPSAASPPPAPAPPSGSVVPATPDALISIDTDVNVMIRGWADERVAVVGELPTGYDITVQQFEERIEIRVDGPGGEPPPSGRIRVGMPAEAHVMVQTRRGDVFATGLRGTAVVGTVSGDVEVNGKPEQVEVSTTSGDVTLRGMGHRVLVNTISGTIEAYEVAGDVRMNSVSGPIRMQSERLDRLDVKTISGDVDVTGKLAKGPHKIDAEGGAVKVRVSTDAPLSIEVTTASGTITDAFSDPPTRAKTRHQRNLAGGGPVLRIETVAGNIELAPRR